VFDFDCVVAGAGVAGLAIARTLALDGCSVLVAEAAEDIGTVTSSRNSEVVHAGIYYPAGSLKARLCVEGRERLYAYCAERGVPVRRIGKLIVATSGGQRQELDRLAAHARANGVTDLVLLSRAEALALEPELECVAALLSPSTGILDSHAFMQALQADALAAGAQFALRTPVLGARRLDAGYAVDFGGADPISLWCRMLVNAAGHGAPALARSIEGLAPQTVPAAYFCKGSYASLTGRAPFSRLVYPVPQAAGLGIHLTLDMAGAARFGPDVEWVDRADDCAVRPERIGRFAAAVRQYWPGLPAGALVPAYAGVRPKISPPGAPAADFVIAGPRAHGMAGLVNLFGIESPGLTSALALAERVKQSLDLPAANA